MKYVAPILAILLVLSLPVGFVGASEYGDYYDLDDNPLSESDAINEYNEEGVVERSISSPAVTIAVADSRSDVGLDSRMWSDWGTTYVAITYDSDKPATVRVKIPDDYVQPYVRKGVETEDRGYEADLSVDGNNLAVEVSFSASGTAVVPVKRSAGVHYGMLTNWGDRLGLNVGGDDDWTYAHPDALRQDSAMYAITTDEPEELQIQYQRLNDDGEPEWRTVPSSPRHSAPIYWMERDGAEDRVYVVSQSTDAPQIRYKIGASVTDRASGATSGVGDIIDRILDDITGVFNW